MPKKSRLGNCSSSNSVSAVKSVWDDVRASSELNHDMNRLHSISQHLAHFRDHRRRLLAKWTEGRSFVFCLLAENLVHVPRQEPMLHYCKRG